MKLTRRFRTSLGLAVSGVLLAAMPAVAPATPGTGISASILARGKSAEGIKVDARGATEVTVRELTIAPGGSTGWHWHAGALIAVVKSGTLTRTLQDCSTVVTPAGASFLEPAGKDHLHIGRNLGAEPLVLVVSYLVPAGRPLSEDAPAPPRCER